MKFLLAIVAFYCIAQGVSAVYVPEDMTVEELASRLSLRAVVCLINELRQLEVQKPQIGALIREVVETLTDLLRGLRACQDILSDPPTRIEEVRHDICMASLTAQAGISALQIRRLFNAEVENLQAIRDGVSNALDKCL